MTKSLRFISSFGIELTMVVKIYLTLDVDKDEYPIPADGDPSEEIQEALEEFIYDIDGLSKTYKNNNGELI